jgi:hypothetical protein
MWLVVKIIKWRSRKERPSKHVPGKRAVNGGKWYESTRYGKGGGV